MMISFIFSNQVPHYIRAILHTKEHTKALRLSIDKKFILEKPKTNLITYIRWR